MRYSVDKNKVRGRQMETESQRAERIRFKTLPRADLEKPLQAGGKSKSKKMFTALLRDG